jgi:hypothetical protein
VIARPPADGDVLVDLRSIEDRGIRIDGSRHGLYFLEDARGVRLVDLHSSAGERASLLWPASHGPLYLHDPAREVEYRLTPREGVVDVDSLTPGEPRNRPRGALVEAFRQLFAEPFGLSDVTGEGLVAPAEPPAPSAWDSPWVLGGTVVTAVGLSATVALGALAWTAAANTQDPYLAASERQKEGELAATFGVVAGASALLLAAGAAGTAWAFFAETEGSR